MVNTNIQGVVPLAGKGFTAKQLGNYQPGEFNHLNNAFINDEGNLVSRPVIACAIPFNTNNSNGIIGHYDDYILVSSSTLQTISRFRNDDSQNLIFDQSDLPDAAGLNSGKRLLAFFQYNRGIYWLSQQIITDGTGKIITWKYFLHYKLNYQQDPAELFPLVELTYAGLTTVEILSFTSNNPIYDFKGFFIHKERLWITLGSGMYFSKATDPSIFAAPDGGFFLFPETQINHAVGHKDSIYVFCDESIYSINYEGDPNVDASSRKVSGEIGGLYSCIHGDFVYTITNGWLYRVSDYAVDPVLELKIDLNAFNSNFKYKIVSYQEFIVLVRYQSVVYGAATNISTIYDNFTALQRQNLGKMFEADAAFIGYAKTEFMNYSTYLINMNTMSLSSITCLDAKDRSGVNRQGNFVDLFVNPHKTLDGESRLYLVSNRRSTGDYSSCKSNVYFLSNDRDELKAKDLAWNDTLGELRYYMLDYYIRIINYVPDGSEYSIKKFRNLLMEALFPSNNFQVSVGMDNEADFMSVSLSSDAGAYDDLRTPPFPARVGINQRGRSINITFLSINPLLNYAIIDANPNYSPLFIRDIRVLWMYTQRVIESKIQNTLV